MEQEDARWIVRGKMGLSVTYAVQAMKENNQNVPQLGSLVEKKVINGNEPLGEFKGTMQKEQTFTWHLYDR